jgi:phosphoribosyl 1,2-cyclic phosphodiesterase
MRTAQPAAECGLSFASLASSSTYGNSYLICGGGSRVLIDCGLSRRAMEQGLIALGVAPGTLDAIFVTHEHGDHTRSLCLKTSFAQKHGIPVYAPALVWRLCGGAYGLDNCFRATVADGDEVRAGGLKVAALGKPHDGAEPLCFVVRSATAGATESVAVVTDLGHLPETLAASLRGATACILESNHDVEMELNSGRPRHLIRRVLGDRGHLSNEQAARAAVALATAATRVIALAHLSLDCNLPDLAVKVVSDACREVGLRPTVEALPAGAPSRAFRTS